MRLDLSVGQRVQELAVHYVLLEQQYLEYGIGLAIKRDLRPKIALLTKDPPLEDEPQAGKQDSLLAEVDQLVVRRPLRPFWRPF